MRRFFEFYIKRAAILRILKNLVAIYCIHPKTDDLWVTIFVFWTVNLDAIYCIHPKTVDFGVFSGKLFWTLFIVCPLDLFIFRVD